MEAYFDHAAGNYDATFTHGDIATSQRLRVWNYLESVFERHEHPLKVLELNCGTGQDAIWMAKKGNEIHATDISVRMLEETCKKMVLEGLSNNISTEILDLNDLDSFDARGQYDLIFSNFGGLNCLNHERLKNLSEHCRDWLKPNGELVFVMMPKETQIDSWYRLMKFKWKSRTQRRNGFAKVNVEGKLVPCYYYNTQELTNLFQGFKTKLTKSIGFIPSYFESSIQAKPWLRFYLEKWESDKYDDSKWVNKSDHYLISMIHE